MPMIIVQSSVAPFVVVRFSSLGDVVLATAAVAAFRKAHPDQPVVFVTKAVFAALPGMVPGVEVLSLGSEEAPGLIQLARAIRRRRPAAIVDLHGTLRARILRLLLPLARWRRYDRAGRARARLLAGRRAEPLEHVVQRFGHALGVGVEFGPWLVRQERRDKELLALVPGAAWPTKQWTEAGWQALAQQWRAAGGRVAWVGGSAEEALVERLAEVADERWLGLDWPALADRLAQAGTAVAGDTGVGHLAAAVGTPVVTIMGPTVPELGYTPWGVHRTVGLSLDCRPCSAFGDDRCPLGHHRCMRELAPATVTKAVEQVAVAAKAG